MKIFLDTANFKEIKDAHQMGLVDGVTTNPSLMCKEQRSCNDVLKEICRLVKGPVNAEVIGETSDKMVAEAAELSKIAENIVIKIPMTPEGLKAVRQLESQGIKTNVTLCFSPLQAILAAKAGASYISFFVGRLDDAGHDGMEVIRQVKTILNNYRFKTQLIVASIRHPLHVVESALAGADIATIPSAVFEKMFKHPLTTAGIEIFLKDWAKIPK